MEESEKRKAEDQGRERWKKEDQSCFWEGRKIGPLKRRGRSHLVRWDCGAKRIQVKMRKTHKHIAMSKWSKHTSLRAVLEVEMSEKSTPLWREAHFEGTMLKTHRVRTTFGRRIVIISGRRNGFCTLTKMSQMCGFCSTFKHDDRRGTCEEGLPRCIAWQVQHETHLHQTC